MKNNFQQLEEKMISRYGSPPPRVKKRIDGTISAYQMAGIIIELFTTTLGQTMVNLSRENKDPLTHKK